MYEKKIKYLELWENGEKLQSAGFLRVEVKYEKVNFQLKVERLRVTDKGKFPIILCAAQKEVKLGEIMLDNGCGNEEWLELSAAELVEGISYKEIEKIYIKLYGERELRCVIQEKSEFIRIERAVGSEESEVKEYSTEEIEGEDERVTREQLSDREAKSNEGMRREIQKGFAESKAEEGGMQECEVEEGKRLVVAGEIQGSEAKQPVMRQLFASTKWQQLWNLYPHIAPFGDEREYLQMKPEDFVILNKEFYPLSSNSFLLHGFYNYNHVVLCKMAKGDGEHYYIGVPGNFYAKEKQAAVLFGFESFEGKTEPAKNGDFGYYMIGVEI